MPVQTDFTVGRQMTLALVVNGEIVATGALTELEYKQEKIKLKSRPLNGKPVNKWIPDGWTGTLTFDRQDSTLDDYFSDEEENWWNSGDVAQIYIYETVAENDGSTSQYQFNGVQLEFDGGMWKQDDKVTQKASFVASDRPRVS